MASFGAVTGRLLVGTRRRPRAIHATAIAASCHPNRCGRPTLRRCLPPPVSTAAWRSHRGQHSVANASATGGLGVLAYGRPRRGSCLPPHRQRPVAANWRCGDRGIRRPHGGVTCRSVASAVRPRRGPVVPRCRNEDRGSRPRGSCPPADQRRDARRWSSPTSGRRCCVRSASTIFTYRRSPPRRNVIS